MVVAGGFFIFLGVIILFVVLLHDFLYGRISDNMEEKSLWDCSHTTAIKVIVYSCLFTILYYGICLFIDIRLITAFDYDGANPIVWFVCWGIGYILWASWMVAIIVNCPLADGITIICDGDEPVYFNCR